jgi:hypothetical protein
MYSMCCFRHPCCFMCPCCLLTSVKSQLLPLSCWRAYCSDVLAYCSDVLVTAACVPAIAGIPTFFLLAFVLLLASILLLSSLLLLASPLLLLGLLLAVFRIWSRIRMIRKFLGLPNPLIIKQNSKKTLDCYCFVTSL